LTTPEVAYMVYGMSDPVKTTVYLAAGDYRRLKTLADSQGRSAAALIREAIAEYARRHAAPTRPRSIGALQGEPDLSARTEELLDGFGADR
jgi:hypothetical protein